MVHIVFPRPAKKKRYPGFQARAIAVFRGSPRGLYERASVPVGHQQGAASPKGPLPSPALHASPLPGKGTELENRLSFGRFDLEEKYIWGGGQGWTWFSETRKQVGCQPSLPLCFRCFSHNPPPNYDLGLFFGSIAENPKGGGLILGVYFLEMEIFGNEQKSSQKCQF